MFKLKPALQSSQGRSLPWSGARLVNCFSEKADGDKRDDFAVMAIPGIVQFADISASAIRGSHVMAGGLYAVAGDTLYSIDATGAASALGIVGGSGPVQMADNGHDLAIVSGSSGYVWNGATLAIPTDLPDVSGVGYIDGYMLWTIYGSDQFLISALDDATTYDLLDIATVEGSPDNLVGVVINHREVLFPGTDSTEIWYNSGNADFPFERQGNAFIERGCFDRDSIVKVDNSVHFMGDDRIIYRLDGYNPVRISTHAAEYALRNATFARAFTYTMEGHKFYCLTVDDATWCYDMATGAWAERETLNQAYWRVNGAVQVYGKTLFSDAFTGQFGEPSLDLNTEYDDYISVRIDLPTIDTPDRNYATMYAFEVLCETGVGNSGTSDPKIMLSYSDNGGRTYSNELWRSMGVVGTYRTRAIWRMLGRFRQRQMRLVITDAARRLVISYHAEIR